MAQPIELQPQAITVQELAAINSRQVPERYIREGVGALDASFPVLDVPTIDVQLLASSSSTSGDELDKLRSVLSSFGCFQVCFLANFCGQKVLTIKFLDFHNIVDLLYFNFIKNFHER